MEKKSKILEECCEGYKIRDDAETDASCLPFCEKCVAGVCVAPNECQCDPGYHGDECTHSKSESIIIKRRFSFLFTKYLILDLLIYSSLMDIYH